MEVGEKSWKRVEVLKGIWKLPPDVVVELSVFVS